MNSTHKTYSLKSIHSIQYNIEVKDTEKSEYKKKNKITGKLVGSTVTSKNQSFNRIPLSPYDPLTPIYAPFNPLLMIE